MGDIRLLLIAAAAATALGAASAPVQVSANELVVNGSFEADSFTGSGLGYRLGLVGSDVTGWFIPASDGTYPWGLQNVNAFGAGPARDGNQWIVIGETGAGGPSHIDYTIQQTVSGLTPGATYTLKFSAASEEAAGGGAMGEVSFLSGATFAPMDFSAPVRGSTFWSPWGDFSTTFVATGTSAVLQFKDLAVEFTDAGDLGLDMVSISSLGVPEPATWAMMAAGFFGLGLMVRRRSGAAATA